MKFVWCSFTIWLVCMGPSTSSLPLFYRDLSSLQEDEYAKAQSYYNQYPGPYDSFELSLYNEPSYSGGFLGRPLMMDLPYYIMQPRGHHVSHHQDSYLSPRVTYDDLNTYRGLYGDFDDDDEPQFSGQHSMYDQYLPELFGYHTRPTEIFPRHVNPFLYENDNLLRGENSLHHDVDYFGGYKKRGQKYKRQAKESPFSVASSDLKMETLSALVQSPQAHQFAAAALALSIFSKPGSNGRPLSIEEPHTVSTPTLSNKRTKIGTETHVPSKIVESSPRLDELPGKGAAVLNDHAKEKERSASSRSDDNAKKSEQSAAAGESDNQPEAPSSEDDAESSKKPAAPASDNPAESDDKPAVPVSDNPAESDDKPAAPLDGTLK